MSRLSNWRNGFATAASEAFDLFKKQYADDLDTPEEISEHVKAYLTTKGDPPHFAFWWREWEECEEGKVRKKVRLSMVFFIVSTYMISKGMFQNPLIMYTLAHAHFVEYGDDIPSQLNEDNNPVGAIILSLPAVSTTLTPSPML